MGDWGGGSVNGECEDEFSEERLADTGLGLQACDAPDADADADRDVEGARSARGSGSRPTVTHMSAVLIFGCDGAGGSDADTAGAEAEAEPEDCIGCECNECRCAPLRNRHEKPSLEQQPTLDLRPDRCGLALAEGDGRMRWAAGAGLSRCGAGLALAGQSECNTWE